MIADIRLVNTANEEKKIGVGIGVPFFQQLKLTDSGGRIYDVLKGNVTKVKWRFQGKECCFESENLIDHVYPSDDLQQLIVIFHFNSKDFKAPNNAAIFSGSGHFVARLSPPPFVSDTLLAALKVNGDPNPPVELNYPGALFFKQTYWRKGESSQTETVIQIAYDQEWVEHRLFYARTNQFGKAVFTSKI